MVDGESFDAGLVTLVWREAGPSSTPVGVFQTLARGAGSGRRREDSRCRAARVATRPPDRATVAPREAARRLYGGRRGPVLYVVWALPGRLSPPATHAGAARIATQAVVKERAVCLRTMDRPDAIPATVPVLDGELVALISAVCEDGFDRTFGRAILCGFNLLIRCAQLHISLETGRKPQANRGQSAQIPRALGSLAALAFLNLIEPFSLKSQAICG